MSDSRKTTFHYPRNRKKRTKKSDLKNVSWHVSSVLLCTLLVMTILIYVIRHCHFEFLTSWILFACSCVLVFKHAHWWIRPCWNDVSVICTQGHISSAVTCSCILNRSIFFKTASLQLLLKVIWGGVSQSLRLLSRIPLQPYFWHKIRFGNSLYFRF